MSTERLRRLGPVLASNRVKFFIRLNPHYQSVGTNLLSGGLKDQMRNFAKLDSNLRHFFRQSFAGTQVERTPCQRQLSIRTSSWVGVVELGLTPALRDTLALVYPSSTQRYIDRAQRAFQVLNIRQVGGLNYLHFSVRILSASSELGGSIAVMLKLHQVVL